MSATVGQIIVRAIEAEGVDRVFCVPGESYLPVLDAFNDAPGVDLITAHHEEGAGFMADAWARTTGRPGVFMVTRGPGLAHAAIALHAARQDSTPLVVLVGQVPREDAGRESFQELDMVGFGKLLGKDGVEIVSADRAVEQVQRAFYLAQSGRPGPVLLSLPEDLGYATSTTETPARQRVPRPGVNLEDVAAAASALRLAGSVAMVVGGGLRGEAARQAAIALAEATGATVYGGWRRFDAFPNSHPQYAGNLPWLSSDLLGPLRGADVVVALGTRFGDFSSLSYSVPGDGQLLIQVSSSAESMNVVRNPDVPVVGDAGPVAEAITAALADRPAADALLAERRTRTADVHRCYLDSTVPEIPVNDQDDPMVDLPSAIAALRDVLPPDGAITCDAGAFSGYLNRYFRWDKADTFYGSTSGSMGYAIPAAIGAKLADPARPVVAIAGDGGSAMTMSEIHTAVRLGLGGLVFVDFDNGTYGSIRAHQERRFPGREIGVDQGSLDLAGCALAMGAAAYCARTNAEFVSAMSKALAEDRPAVVHAFVSPLQIRAWA
ncbi:thiamine pyrophosphate-binding protein [Nakamurella lactea]|uniref:thiamine pyrophosphate-binding protein n=1 Tax=Nakamurella lactea TaxID=459515 RepID=UPI000405939C|nr:thiamine pyrophosphate-binding protein [Nakamurella lactea]